MRAARLYAFSPAFTLLILRHAILLYAMRHFSPALAAAYAARSAAFVRYMRYAADYAI